MSKPISAWLAPLGPGEATVHPYTNMSRPPKLDEAWVAVPDDDWTLAVPPTQTRCRRGSPRDGYCGRPPVAALHRGRDGRLWSYCERHLYGRWIEGGRVMGWRVRR